MATIKSEWAKWLISKEDWKKLMRGVLEEKPELYPPDPSWLWVQWRRIKDKLSDWFDYVRGITPLESEHDILVHQLRGLAIETLVTDNFDYDECRRRRDQLAQGVLDLIAILEDY